MRCTTIQNRVLAAVLLGTALLLTACRPDLLVRVGTRVYHDGAIDRSIEVFGRKEDGNVPSNPDWLSANVGLRLARPDAWSRVIEAPGHLRADGYFPGVDHLPPMLTFSTETGSRSDRVDTNLSIETRSVVRRWVYREQHADPYSRGEVQDALDALVELVVEAVESELQRYYGPDFDTSGAVTFLRTEGRGLASAIVSVRRQAAGVENYRHRTELWKNVLTQYGLRAVSHDPEEFDFWGAHMPIVMEWLRDRVAQSVSTPDRRIDPSSWTFWPIHEDETEELTAIVERVWGSEERLLELAGPHFGALSGYYGSDNSPRFRFESAIRMPGRLLRTNGTPTEEGAVWTFRAEDLSFGDVILRAESVELQQAALTHIGARRELDVLGLLQLVDLLWERDPDNVLLQLLDKATEQGNLEPLRDEDEIPDVYTERVKELLFLLDPAGDLPPTLTP